MEGEKEISGNSWHAVSSAPQMPRGLSSEKNSCTWHCKWW